MVIEMTLEEDIFQKTKINYDKLISYGFHKQSHQYIYVQDIFDHTFQVIIIIQDNDSVQGHIIDLAFQEEYTNYRIKTQGEFVSKVRQEFMNILNDIKEQCTSPQYFLYPQSNRIAQYIIEKYHEYPEFLWDSDPQYGVFRHQSNQKWYALIMNINKNKLDSDNQDIEIVNLKLKEDHIQQLLHQKGFYRAYHMNKQKWISIILDDTLSDYEIIQHIDESYQLTQSIHEWIIPVNPQNDDIFHCFNHTDTILWQQFPHIRKDDWVYVYVNKPYNYLLYQCQVIETDISDNHHNYLMKIKHTHTYTPEEYPFHQLKDYGIKTIRNVRKITSRLHQKLHQ